MQNPVNENGKFSLSSNFSKRIQIGFKCNQELIRLVHFFQHEFLSVVHECLITLRDILEEKRWKRSAYLGFHGIQAPSPVRSGGLGCPVDTSWARSAWNHSTFPVQLLHVLVGSLLVLLEWIQQKYNDIALIYLSWISWANRDSPVREAQDLRKRKKVSNDE